ncbi:MAG: N-acetyltransferase [Proteobacteria bacterium]|nr:MAG: N-acetyltransferase [Pseudomonadota bacterium]
MTITPILETARVFLREITLEDEDLLLDLDSDPEVMRYISQGMPSNRSEVTASIERIRSLYVKHQGRFGCWAAINKTNDEFIGWFLFRPSHSDPDNTKRIELGYRLKKTCWSKGYATEVSQAILLKAMENPGIEEVFAVAVKDNVGSQNVMKKCGMQLVREFASLEFTENLESLVEFSISMHSVRAN